jgi:hypothetical protein
MPLCRSEFTVMLSHNARGYHRTGLISSLQNLKMAAFWVVPPSGLVEVSNLLNVAELYQFTRCKNSKGSDLHTRSRGNPKSGWYVAGGFITDSNFGRKVRVRVNVPSPERPSTGFTGPTAAKAICVFLQLRRLKWSSLYGLKFNIYQEAMKLNNSVQSNIWPVFTSYWMAYMTFEPDSITHQTFHWLV